jgi:hypothetical protein
LGEAYTEIIKLTANTLGELITQLRGIAAKIAEKRVTGFERDAPYFKYDYYIGEEISNSHKSCSDCVAHQTMIYTGEEVRMTFPNARGVSPYPMEPHSIYPNVHEGDATKTRECGCELKLTNAASGAAAILVDEIRGEILVG